jgi:4-hydroxybenzoate polyprenyltransferase
VNKGALFYLGLGLASKVSYSLKDRLFGFLTLVPPIFLFLTPINAASAVVLSIGGYPPWDKAILGLITVAFAGWGVNALNHYIDRERDKIIWSQRALPAGRVHPTIALVSALLAFICALLLSWFFFNPTNFVILLLAIILGAFYSAYLRDRFGYLSLPPIVGLVSLGGWSAFSPETLFSSWLPWFLYFLHFSWQAGHIMIYYPIHVTAETAGKPSIKIPPAFFFVPSTRMAVSIGIGFVCLTLLLSILLPLMISLSYLYLLLVLASGVYGLVMGIRFLRNTSDNNKGLQAFTAVSMFRLVTVMAILVDVFLSQI